jgi:cytochrome c oxidase subunit 3
MFDNITKKEQHPYHLVDPSPWPFMVAISLLHITFSFVMYLHSYKYSNIKLHLGFIFLILFIGCWFLDVIKESTFEGYHTLKVQNGLRFGMVLFIVSEIFFFFSFFWAFFHSSIHPTIALGCSWPPKNIQVLDPLSLPLLNTVLLLSSGIILTYAHRSLVCGYKSKVLDSLTGTILYGLVFTILQALEYTYAAFSINDSVYGSLFFLCTGFLRNISTKRGL